MTPTPIFLPSTFNRFFRSTRRKWLALAIPFCSVSAALAHEIVMSQPAETDFSVPGVRPTHIAWLEMIRSAKESIRIEQFYVNTQPGSRMEEVLSALKQAAKRGVEVRLLVDSKFYDKYPEVPDTLAQISGFGVKTIDFGKGVQHAKYFIVDQTVMYSGSANFDWLALEHIHETGLVLEDRAILGQFTALFELDWKKGTEIGSTDTAQLASRAGNRKRGQLPHRPVHQPVQKRLGEIAKAETKGSADFTALASPPSRLPKGIRPTLDALVASIQESRQSLKIQLYQYSTRGDSSSKPWLVLDNALRAAAARGVKIQLLVDDVALNSAESALRSLAAVPNFEIRRVKIQDWSEGKLDHARLVHSKYLIADTKKAWLGSENWRENYFFSTRNIGLLFTQAKLVNDLNAVFEKAWKSPLSHAL